MEAQLAVAVVVKAQLELMLPHQLEQEELEELEQPLHTLVHL
jgi:hypothetical protein